MHVLCKIVGIVEVDDTLLMGVYHILGQKEPLCDILAHLSRHIVSLYTVYGRVLVGVLLLYFLIIALKKA